MTDTTTETAPAKHPLDKKWGPGTGGQKKRWGLGFGEATNFATTGQHTDLHVQWQGQADYDRGYAEGLAKLTEESDFTGLDLETASEIVDVFNGAAIEHPTLSGETCQVSLTMDVVGCYNQIEAVERMMRAVLRDGYAHLMFKVVDTGDGEEYLTQGDVTYDIDRVNEASARFAEKHDAQQPSTD